MALKFKEDPDFAVHNGLANDTAARDLRAMIEQIEAMAAAKGDATRRGTRRIVMSLPSRRGTMSRL